jgi:uncharacterized protein YkwD
MAQRTVTRIGLVGAAAIAALSACNPIVATHAAGRHQRPSPRPVASPTATTTVTPSTPSTPSTPTPSPTATTTPSPTASASDAYEARILVLVNVERANAGLSAVSASTCADGFAEAWAPVIQRNGALSHQSLSPILSTCHSSTAGENVAYGNVTADQMMTMWMNSPGHRANILNPSFTGIGIAAVTDSSGRWYGVQDFVG